MHGVIQLAFIDSLFARADQESQSLLLAALEQLAEGVIVADANGELIYVNSAAANIHGVSELNVSPDEYSETYHLLTVDGDPYPTSQLPLSRTVASGETVRDARWKIRHPDGHIVDAVGTSRPVLDEQGKQIGSVLTLADRTEEIAAQEELAAALKAKNALLFEVNHRVKNNLAIVTALLGLYARRVDDPDAARAFKDASARVGVLVDIHRRLYALGTHHNIEVVEFLARLTEETARTLSIERPVEVLTKQDGACEMPTDKATTLALALNELVLNSLKHAFAEVENPKIELEMVVGEDRFEITYRDNGPGMTDGASGGGSGIGRALISQLTTSLSAKIEQLVSEPGFCMHIEIPLSASK